MGNRWGWNWFLGNKDKGASTYAYIVHKSNESKTVDTGYTCVHGCRPETWFPHIRNPTTGLDSEIYLPSSIPVWLIHPCLLPSDRPELLPRVRMEVKRQLSVRERERKSVELWPRTQSDDRHKSSKSSSSLRPLCQSRKKKSECGYTFSRDMQAMIPVCN